MGEGEVAAEVVDEAGGISVADWKRGRNTVTEAAAATTRISPRLAGPQVEEDTGWSLTWVEEGPGVGRRTRTIGRVVPDARGGVVGAGTGAGSDIAIPTGIANGTTMIVIATETVIATGVIVIETVTAIWTGTGIGRGTAIGSDTEEYYAILQQMHTVSICYIFGFFLFGFLHLFASF